MIHSVFLDIFHVLDVHLLQIQTCYSKANYSQEWKWLSTTAEQK
jgi:hypothetical protein